MSILIDNYSESQKNSDTLAIYLNNSYKGQSFGNSGIDIILDSVVFYLKKTSTPTGNMVVQVYELTGASGSEKPTGSVLATSDPYEASDLTTSYQLIPFTFSGSNRITLSANTRYVAIGYFVGDTSSNKVVLGSRTTTPGASGNFSYSADGSSWTANSSFDICFYVYGETIPIIYNDSPPLNLIKKIFNYKVYTNTGQYITTWLDVIEDPSFQTVINGGSVQMQIKLARKTQDFGEELDVAFGNEVQVWCFDTDAPAGIKIFSGYISRYDPSNDGPNEYVSVYCLGYHTVLKDYIHDNGNGATDPSYVNEDATKIAEYAINNARLLGCPVNWTEQTLQKTGQEISYNFQINTLQEVMDKILELTPDRWYWYVDANKNLHWHPKAENPIHTFTIGKEIFYIQAQKRTEAVCNRLYYVGGTPDGGSQVLYSRYERSASISQYGLKAQKKTDSRIKTQDMLDLIANNALDLLQSAEIRTIIKIKDNNYDPQNGYDIESIKVGDTCQIRNYQDAFNSSRWDVMFWDIDYWDFNVRNLTETVMQIMQINYTPDFVELTISSKLPDVIKTSRLIAKDLIDYIVKDVPSNPSMGINII